MADKLMPGFGEQMRQISLNFAHGHPVAPGGGDPRQGLIINLPGQPKSIAETLEGIEGRGVHGIFSAVPYCIDLIGGPTSRPTKRCARPSVPKRDPRRDDDPRALRHARPSPAGVAAASAQETVIDYRISERDTLIGPGNGIHRPAGLAEIARLEPPARCK